MLLDIGVSLLITRWAEPVKKAVHGEQTLSNIVTCNITIVVMRPNRPKQISLKAISD